jgi:predicted nucleic acid-binding protein
MAVPRYVLDANVIVRFLAGDHPEHTKRSAAVIEQAERGEAELVLLPWVLAEAVYVLGSVYEVNRRKVAEALTEFIGGPGIATEDSAVVADALDRYAKRKVDFADALLAAYAAARGLAAASFDRDLDRFTDITRHEP